MKMMIQYRRLKPDTLNGDMIQVTTTYSSYNASEIDAIEADLKKNIGFCLVQEIPSENLRT